MLLKSKNYRSMPWKNGRGVTLEIAREPAAGEEFAWRLSLAQIDADCDLSPYPGYRRALVLVSGNSLQLRFRGHGSSSLGGPYAIYQWHGGGALDFHVAGLIADREIH